MTALRIAVEEAASPLASSLTHARVELFESLGWQARPLAADGADLVSLAAADMPQILVGAGLGSERSVSLGYSHEAQFALDWTYDGFRLFPSTAWIQTPGDRPIIDIADGRGPKVEQAIAALDRRRFPALRDERVRPQIDPLVLRLAKAFAALRLRAVEAELEDQRRGERLAFHLFHQLLFMRFHEDHYGPIDSVPRIADVASAGKPAKAVGLLSDLMTSYGSRFDSELFEEGGLVERLPRSAVLDVVKELTEPWERLRLDFSVASNDIAGRLYQSYLALSPQLVDVQELFPVARSVNRQRATGAFYTPRILAKFVTSRALGAWLRRHEPQDPSDVRVLDLACGSGVFLLESYRLLLSYFEVRVGRALKVNERIDILVKCIFGADTDESAVAMARVQLLEEARIGSRRLPHLAENIQVADSLSERIVGPAAWDNAREGFDVIVSNPPFHSPAGARKSGYDTTALGRRFLSAKGTGWNLAYVFLERAHQLLRRGGFVGVVVPQVMLDGPSSSAIRGLIGSDRVSTVVDFGRLPVFAGNMVYVAAVIAHADGQPDGGVELTRFFDSGSADEDLTSTLREFTAEELLGESRGYSVNVSSESLRGLDSWSPFVLRWSQLLHDQVEARTVPFNTADAPTVVVGTQTGNDSKFVLAPSRYVQIGDKIVVDRRDELLASQAPKWVPGRSIRPFRMEWSGKRVVLPQLGRSDQLDDFVWRMGGKPKSFFPGRLDILQSPKVLVRCLFDEVAAVADSEGEWLIPQGGGGAHAIATGSPEEAEFVEALLNSSLYQWLLSGISQPKSSGFGQILLHHWRHVPWPLIQEEDRAAIVTAGRRVHASFDAPAERRTDEYWQARLAVDEAVLAALGVGETLRATIAAELRRRP